MALDINENSLARDLVEISSKYLDWYMKVVRKLLYPEAAEIEQNIIVSEMLKSWLKEARENKDIEEQSLEELDKNHDALLLLVQEHIENTQKTNEKPDYAEFNVLTMIFEGFYDKMRRLESDLMSCKSGLNALTGLKSQDIMESDIKREMDRLARQGKPFSLALLRVNNFEHIMQNQGAKKAEGQIRHVSAMIRKALRSYDDAYYIENAEFILSLKQTDITDGLRALERLEDLLRKNNSNAENENISVSCYVAEPSPNDEIDDLIDNLRRDLNKTGGDKSAVYEYHDLSPLQRFVKNQ